MVDQHRVGWGDFGGSFDVCRQRRLVVDDLHAAATKHVGRPDEHRIADLVGDALRLGKRTSESVLRGRQPGLRQHATKGAPLLGKVDRLRTGAHNRNAGIFESLSESQRGLSTELHDDACYRSRCLLGTHDLEYVLEC